MLRSVVGRAAGLAPLQVPRLTAVGIADVAAEGECDSDAAEAVDGTSDEVTDTLTAVEPGTNDTVDDVAQETNDVESLR